MTAKADRAEKLIQDPELQDAFKVVREFWRDKIEETPLHAKDGDDALFDIRKMLFLLRSVEEALQTAIEDGHLEDFRAKEQEGRGFLKDIRTWPTK